ncbi:MAG: hypothetical protein IPF84_07075 [Proteobacteria bacterium]|nr:hypothetical protein [Pseudomonadota bacterium]
MDNVITAFVGLDVRTESNPAEVDEAGPCGYGLQVTQPTVAVAVTP